jgi:excinuclease UvrABC nuclease subunit
MASNWSKWRRFPDPRKLEMLVAPFGPGCYELRDETGPILFGKGKNVASRMSSLLPKPLGAGTRNNSKKQIYVLRQLGTIEYRTLGCATEGEAKLQEQEIKNKRNGYKFPT